MATERIQIIVEERGTRVVQRNIRNIGTTAETSSRSVSLLRKALLALGVASVTRSVLGLADAFVEINNRIRVAQNGVGDVSASFDRLYAIAQRTRAPLDDLARLYARAGLAATELGASQAQLMRLTENVGLALAIQGGSIEGVRGALLQLGQALGSGVVRAEEFNSILEGALPIAQAAARGIEAAGGSVARLRTLVLEGKITSDVFFRALLSQSDELEKQFANTTKTLRQQMTTLRNAFINFFGRLDQGLGGTQALGQAINFLANNLGELARALTVAAATLLVVKLAPFVGRLHAAADAALALRAAVASGNAVLLTSAEATRQRTVAQIGSLKADLAKNRVAIAQVEAELLLASTLANSNKAAATQAALTQQLTILRAQQTAQTNALAVANTRLAVATKQASLEASLLGRAYLGVRSQLAALAGLVAANPLGALLIALGTASALLVVYSDKIRLSAEETTTLRDVGIAVFEEFGYIIKEAVNALASMVGALQPVKDAIESTFGGVVPSLRSILQFGALVADRFVGIFVGAFYALGRTFRGLPDIISSAVLGAVNVTIGGVESLLNFTIRGINVFTLSVIANLNELIALANKASNALGQGDVLSPIDAKGKRIGNLDFGRIENDFASAAEDFSTAVVEGFKEGLTLTTGVQDLLNRALERADLRAQQREAEAAIAALRSLDTGLPEGERTGDATAPANLAAMAALNQELAREAELLGMTARAREIANRMHEIENTLAKEGITLSDSEKEMYRTRLENLQALNDQAQILQSLRGPQEEFAAGQAAINALFEDGKISLREYQTAMNELRLIALESATSVEAGFERGFLRLNETLNDFASLAEATFTNAFSSMEDALVDFVTTGEFNFSKLIDSILADIARLVARQAISGLLGAVTGGSFGFGGGFGEFLFGGGRASGGPVEPGRDYLVGERGPEIVRMGAPGQVIPAAQTAAMLGQQEPPQVNVQVVNVTDPEEVSSALNSPKVQDQIVNIIRRNRNAVRAGLGV